MKMFYKTQRASKVSAKTVACFIYNLLPTFRKLLDTVPLVMVKPHSQFTELLQLALEGLRQKLVAQFWPSPISTYFKKC